MVGWWRCVYRAAELDFAPARLTEANLGIGQTGDFGPSCSFKHALTRRRGLRQPAARTPPATSTRRIARTFEQRFPTVPTEDPEILLIDFARAERHGPACHYSERAGERAVARSAYAEAVAHFNTALAGAAGPPPGEDRDRRELAVCQDTAQR